MAFYTPAPVRAQRGQAGAGQVQSLWIAQVARLSVFCHGYPMNPAEITRNH
jgi:hypothetical protein